MYAYGLSVFFVLLIEDIYTAEDLTVYRVNISYIENYLFQNVVRLIFIVVSDVCKYIYTYYLLILW